MRDAATHPPPLTQSRCSSDTMANSISHHFSAACLITDFVSFHYLIYTLTRRRQINSDMTCVRQRLSSMCSRCSDSQSCLSVSSVSSGRHTKQTRTFTFHWERRNSSVWSSVNDVKIFQGGHIVGMYLNKVKIR